MDNPTTTQAATPNEPQDKRAEWITPAITDYDIEEATLGAPWIPGAGDAALGYS